MTNNKEILLLWFTNLLIKSPRPKNKIKQNLQLAEELHKPIIRSFKKKHFILDSKAIFGVLT